jgi:hypothetical protein
MVSLLLLTTREDSGVGTYTKGLSSLIYIPCIFSSYT